MKRIIFSLCCFLSSMGLFAFTHIPADTAVVKGVLPNGLTYYIRHNDYIPNRAEFHIAQKVGAIQETPEQRGLAHFLEHMAFNGTKHFPDKALINYLATVGVKFGANLNAYTSVDETVYMIMDAPTERVATVDSCLLILRDWSDGISLESEAIDKERGVIEEEWRTRNNPMIRQIEENLPIVYGDDKYSDCLPIGHINVIRNFQYETIRQYYKTWYRPDLQGIVIVGDIDVRRTEEAVKRIFSEVVMPEGAPERIYYPVSDYVEPRIIISTDKEMPYSLLSFTQKVDDFPFELKDTEEDFRQDFIRYMAASMLNDRLGDIAKEEMPPFTYPDASYSSFWVSNKQKCFEVSVQVSNAGAEEAFTRMMNEVERIRRFGFTESELERAKKSYLALAEQTYNHRNQHKNEYFVYKCVENFMRGEALTSEEKSFEVAKKMDAEVTVAEVNAWINSWNADNTLIWCMGSDVKELPSEEFIKNELAALPNRELEPYDDVSLPESIIPEELAPQGGKIKTKKHLKNGVIEYKLSNGVSVQFKQTDFKDDEILFSAESVGGCVMVDSTDYVSARFSDELAAAGGIGTMNAIQLKKFLSDKRTSLSASVSNYNEVLSGYASKKDIKYLFELLYANFTAVREDSTAYLSFVQRFITECKDRDKYPRTEFSDSIESVVYGNHVLVRALDIPDLEQLDYNRSLEIFKERFSNAADFKFTIVGSIDEATLEPLLEKYMASLPASSKREKAKRGEPMVVRGNNAVRFDKQMQVPITIAYLFNFTHIKSADNALPYYVLEDILDIVYTEKVREDEGGTYGVGTSVQVNRIPRNYASIMINFTTDASKVDNLLPIIYAELNNIAENGPREVDLQKAKEHKRKSFADLQKSNNYWLSRIETTQMTGKDNAATYLKRLEKVTAKDVQRVAKEFVDSQNRKELVMIGIGAE